ncbi:MAG: S8 family serine peptidase [Lapillicoccus sp.]
MAYRTSPQAPPPSTPRPRAPGPQVPPDALRRHRGTVLVPDQALDRQGRRPDPTAYVADQLLVQGSGAGPALEALVEAAASTGHRIGTSEGAKGKREAYVSELTEKALADLAAKVWVTRFHLQPDPKSELPSSNAWAVLQRYRELAGQDDQYTVGLNHLVTLTSQRVIDGVDPGDGSDGSTGSDSSAASGAEITGSPYFTGPGIPGAPYFTGPGTEGTPYFTGPSTSGNPYFTGPSTGLPYFTGPGLGGRAPVTWLGRVPEPTPRRTHGRRPVVAVLDTGVGDHDWLRAPHVTVLAHVGGTAIGLGNDVPDSELTGVVTDPMLGGLDRDAGHGTFIAGIIRQVCPDARVLALRVMPSDGVVDEHQLTIALNMLLVRQAQAQLTGVIDDVIDVLSLSLGYYHEDPEDIAYSSVLAGTLRQFGRLGVAVVAAAGNDHTSTPMFPAGLASRTHGADQDHDAVPLTSVGACNPSGSTAIFSNDGPWVSCKRPGANVVSTVPTTFNGSGQSPVATTDGREAIDPDNYLSGFGIWSGTSFSAPVLAAELAAHLVKQGGLDDTTASAMVDRGWAAVEHEVKWTRP